MVTSHAQLWTDLSERSMSFDLLKASLVNTALMCKAGLDSSTYKYMFSSYPGYFIFGVLFLVSSHCFACGDLTLPLKRSISVVSLLHCCKSIERFRRDSAALNPCTRNSTLLVL